MFAALTKPISNDGLAQVVAKVVGGVQLGAKE